MKEKGMRIGLASLFVILFNVVFFILGGSSHPASVWISYGFIHFAWLCFVAAPLLSEKNDHAVSRLSVYSVSGVYFLAELVVGLIFIFAAPQSSKAALVIQIVLFGVYLAALLPVLLANRHTSELTQQRTMDSQDIQAMAARVRNLTDRLADETANREIRRVLDQLNALPLSRVDRLYSPEVQSLLSALEEAVKKEDAQSAAKYAQELQRILKN